MRIKDYYKMIVNIRKKKNKQLEPYIDKRYSTPTFLSRLKNYSFNNLKKMLIIGVLSAGLFLYFSHKDILRDIKRYRFNQEQKINFNTKAESSFYRALSKAKTGNDFIAIYAKSKAIINEKNFRKSFEKVKPILPAMHEQFKKGFKEGFLKERKKLLNSIDNVLSLYQKIYNISKLSKEQKDLLQKQITNLKDLRDFLNKYDSRSIEDLLKETIYTIKENSKELKIGAEDLFLLGLIESNFKNLAISPVGAFGPFQFMKGTWKDFAPKPYKDFRYASDPLIASLTAGKYLGTLTARYKDPLLVTTVYNGGSLRLKKKICSIPKNISYHNSFPFVYKRSIFYLYPSYNDYYKDYLRNKALTFLRNKRRATIYENAKYPPKFIAAFYVVGKELKEITNSNDNKYYFSYIHIADINLPTSTYKVRSGDTLAKIAKKYNKSTYSLKVFNISKIEMKYINKHLIYIIHKGDSLYIPHYTIKEYSDKVKKLLKENLMKVAERYKDNKKESERFVDQLISNNKLSINSSYLTGKLTLIIPKDFNEYLKNYINKYSNLEKKNVLERTAIKLVSFIKNEKIIKIPFNYSLSEKSFNSRFFNSRSTVKQVKNKIKNSKKEKQLITFRFRKSKATYFKNKKEFIVYHYVLPGHNSWAMKVNYGVKVRNLIKGKIVMIKFKNIKEVKKIGSVKKGFNLTKLRKLKYKYRKKGKVIILGAGNTKYISLNAPILLIKLNK